MLLVGALLCTAPAVASAPADHDVTTQAIAPTPGRQSTVDEPAPTEPAATPSAPTATPTQPSSSPDATPPATPPSSPPPEEPVEVLRVAVRIPDATGLAVLERVRALDGVAHATSVQVGRSRVGGADGPALTVAAVDVAEYRRFAPQVVADTPGVWERLADGELVVLHEHAGRLGFDLGGPAWLGGDARVRVRVGALASNGIPPVADALVDRATGARLGLDQTAPTVLVGLTEGADADDVAARITEALGIDAEVVPDPRAPTPVTPQPPSGATVWDRLAMCESSGDWTANTGNGYYGGLQFLPESWWLVGGTGMPHEASREEQIHRAELLLQVQGWVAWPVCSVRLGLRQP